MSDGDFLSRWSRRKHEARRSEQAPPVEAAVPAIAPASPVVDANVGVPAPVAVEPLPPLESLTPESDFAPFMKPEVDGSVRREALKTLFADPRFNVMDGLDVYIDDYSKPDPLPAGWLEKMAQVAYLGIYKPPEAADEAAKAVHPPAEAESPVETKASEEAPQDSVPEPAALEEKREAP